MGRRKNREYIETFPNLKALSNVTNAERRFTDGEIIHILEPRQGEAEYYRYLKGEYIPLVEDDSDFTMYDANKQFFAGAPQFDEGQIARAIETINAYASEHKASHYMLLGHDIRYYTILINNPNFFEIDTIGNAVIDCLENIGQIKEIVADEGTNAIECWVTTKDKETVVLYLFPYDEGVIRFGGC